MKKPSPYLILLLLLSLGFTLATVLEARVPDRNDRSGSSVLRLLFGEGRQTFARLSFRMADVYFHSGYYPSFFDQQQRPAEPAVAGGKNEHDEDREKGMDFLGPPRDWIERFGRRFRITKHTHLENGQEREMLPWLRLAADLDPQLVDTYTVAAYWLRSRLGKVDEAEAFLREGLRNNPNSYEILFELGSIYYGNRHDISRARNVWKLALRRWTEQDDRAKKNSLQELGKIAMNLGHLEEGEENLEQAIQLFEMAKSVSPQPDAVQRQIDELKQKLASRPPVGVRKSP